MRIHRITGSAVRDRIDAADQTIMARLSAERSPVLDGFLPTLSRSADFFALWIGIAAVLAAGRGRAGPPGGLAGSGRHGDREHGQQRRRQGAGAQAAPSRRGASGPAPGQHARYHLVSVRPCCRGCRLRYRRRAGNAGAGGAGRGARGGRRHRPGRERRALSVRHRWGWAVGVGVAMLTLRWRPLRRSEPAAAAGPGHEAAAERDLSS